MRIAGRSEKAPGRAEGRGQADRPAHSKTDVARVLQRRDARSRETPGTPAQRSEDAPMNLQQNAKGMVRDLAAPDSDSPHEIDG